MNRLSILKYSSNNKFNNFKPIVTYEWLFIFIYILSTSHYIQSAVFLVKNKFFLISERFR
jgi:hypothetical protein